MKWRFPVAAARIAAMMFWLGAAAPLDAATITVNSAADSGGTCPGATCTLRQAIVSAAPNDTIDFAAGITTISLTSGALSIAKDLTVRGPGANLLKIQRSEGAPPFSIFSLPNTPPLHTTITLSGMTIQGGSAVNGGGITSQWNILNVTDCTLIDNHASSSGGAMYNAPSIGSVNVTNSTISGNSSQASGGGIYVGSGSDLAITNSTISGNSAQASGGGIQNENDNAITVLTVTNSTISGNSAQTTGGGIHNVENLYVINSTISGNTAQTGGGGIQDVGSFRNATITNSTIQGNSVLAAMTGTGGGINMAGSSLVIRSSTIAGNSAASGGGVNRASGSTDVRNSIIAGNTAGTGPDYLGAMGSQGFNLIGNAAGTSFTPTTGDQVNVNPQLGLLQDNGGPTRTMAPLPGSPAIERGHSGGLLTDQRGYARPVDSPTITNAIGGDGSDIGAYEIQPGELPGCENTTVTNSADAGPGSLRYVMANVCAGATISFAPGVSQVTLTSGGLPVDKWMTIAGPSLDPVQLIVQRSADPGTPLFRIFDVAPNVKSTIAGLRIMNGAAQNQNGGGVRVQGGAELQLVSSTLAQNSAFYGGGLSNAGTTLVSSSTITGNAASCGAGLHNASGTLNVQTSTIAGNIADTCGGGVFGEGGTLNLTSATVASNTAVQGGGVRVTSATVSARNSLIAKNMVTFNGPDFSGSLSSQGYNLIGNTGGTGITGLFIGNQLNLDPLLDTLKYNGGPTWTMALLANSPAIDRGHSSGSAADQRGLTRPVNSPAIAPAGGGDDSDIGAYEVQADQLPGCGSPIVTQNGDSGAGSLRAILAGLCGGETVTFAPGVVSPIALTSAALLIDKPVAIHGASPPMTVQRSAAPPTPLFRVFDIATGGKATIAGLVISNGSLEGTDELGAGIRVRSGGWLRLMNSVLTGNGTNGFGGGLANQGTTAIERSTVDANGAFMCGGGLFNAAGTMTLAGSTVAQNSSTNVGGGICSYGGTVLLTSSTVAFNSAGEFSAAGGAFNLQGATMRLRNTIVAKNIGPNPDISGPLNSQGYNLIGITDGGTVDPIQGDQFGDSNVQIDPLFGPLQDNGGPTRTMALLANSPAIDKGHSSGAVVDQRGFFRPIDLPGTPNATGGDGADIGAFESRDVDVDGNGVYEAKFDGLMILRFMFGFLNPALTDNAIGALATRGPPQIATYLANIGPALDFDGNGQIDPLTDGVMLIRYLSGIHGAALSNGVVGPGATRNAAQIEAYIQSLLLITTN